MAAVQTGSWDKDSGMFDGLHLLFDTALAEDYEEKKLLQVIRQGASGRSEIYDYVGKMPSNSVEKDSGTPAGFYMILDAAAVVNSVGKVPSNAVEKAEIVLLTTLFIPAWCCKRKRTMRRQVLTRSSGRCHEVSRSSTGAEEEPLSPVEKAKKKERVQQERPIKKPRREGPEPFEPKDMPRDMRYYIEATLGGTDIFPVSQKTLTKTDVSSHHRRVFLVNADLGFLNEEEKAKLERPNVRDRAISVQVLDSHQVLEPRREPLMLTFTRWELKKNGGGNASTVYVLTKADWVRLVGDNKLDTDDEIQIWSFRVGSRLHMAVVVAKRA